MRSACKALYEQLGSYQLVAETLKELYPDLASTEWLRKLVKIEVEAARTETDLPEADAEVVEQNVRLANRLQRASDINRIERKSFRHHARAANAIEALQSEILDILRVCSKDLSQPTKIRSGSYNSKRPVAVLHLSDLHFNELIDLPHNHYDFVIAAKRLQLLAQKTKLYAKAHQCERIVVALGGDIINSDRRLDEILSMATNRARAVVLATHVLRQLLEDLRTDFFIDVFGITGNEGRAKQELAWGDPAVSDSYDASVYWMLEQLLGQNDKGLRFHPLHGNEVMFQIHKQIFLLLHGHQVNASDQRKVQAIIGKHSAVAGQQVTHVLCGHIHSSLVGDYVSRNASLAGSNAYSDEGLNFASKASQNLHIVSEQGLDGIKLDVQDVTGVDGYGIIEQLEAHEARSVEQVHRANLIKPKVRIIV
jgi:predicted phosphodiesterase